MAYNLNVKSILEIILKAAQKNANILAHRYLLKDESIISKWKNRKAIPRNEFFSLIYTVNPYSL